MEMREIVLRLDHNIFRATVPRGFSVPAETTEGMIVTRMSVNSSMRRRAVAATIRRHAQQPRE
jgi:hypothetical protein